MKSAACHVPQWFNQRDRDSQVWRWACWGLYLGQRSQLGKEQVWKMPVMWRSALQIQNGCKIPFPKLTVYR